MLIQEAPAVVDAPLKRRLIQAIAAATVPAARAAPQPPLEVAVVDLPPWVTPDDGQQRRGVLIELAAQLETSSGQALSTHAVPYVRAMSMLENGRAELMFAYDTPRLGQIADNLGALGSDAIVLLVRRGECCGTQIYRPKRTVGHIRGAAYPVDIITDTAIAKYPFSSYVQGLRMLLGGRLDAVVAPRTSLLYAMQAMRVGPERFGPMTVLRATTLSLYMARRAGDSAQRAGLARACLHLHRREAFGRLVDRYAGRG